MTAGAVARYGFPKGSKVAYLVADYAYGHEMVRGFQRARQAIGAETVGRHPPSAGRSRLLDLPAASALDAPGHPGALQFRPRPGQLDQAGHRLRPEAAGPRSSCRSFCTIASGRRRRGLRGRGRRRQLLLGPRGQDPEREGVQRRLSRPPTAARSRPTTAPRLRRRVVAADGDAGGRRDRHRQGDRCAGRSEVRRGQGRRSSTASATTSRCSRCSCSSRRRRPT